MLLKFGINNLDRPLLTGLFVTGMLVGVVLSLPAQPKSVPPAAFEVVSIKPNPQRKITIPTGETLAGGFRAYLGAPPVQLNGVSGERFEDMAATVGDLIADAYHLRPFQIIGLPKWADFQLGEGYDLQAKIPNGKPATSDQVRLMLQGVLSSRFRLKIHRETRPMPVYELSVAKGGSKLKAVPVPPPVAPGMAGKASGNSGGVKPVEFPTLTRMIEQFLDRPLSDKTGLTGFYENQWNQDELLAERRTVGQGATAPSIFGAVKNQLGLELKATNVPFEVWIVDSVERPSSN